MGCYLFPSTAAGNETIVHCGSVAISVAFVLSTGVSAVPDATWCELLLFRSLIVPKATGQHAF